LVLPVPCLPQGVGGGQLSGWPLIVGGETLALSQGFVKGAISGASGATLAGVSLYVVAFNCPSPAELPGP